MEVLAIAFMFLLAFAMIISAVMQGFNKMQKSVVDARDKALREHNNQMLQALDKAYAIDNQRAERVRETPVYYSDEKYSRSRTSEPVINIYNNHTINATGGSAYAEGGRSNSKSISYIAPSYDGNAKKKEKQHSVRFGTKNEFQRFVDEHYFCFEGSMTGIPDVNGPSWFPFEWQSVPRKLQDRFLDGDDTLPVRIVRKADYHNGNI